MAMHGTGITLQRYSWNWSSMCIAAILYLSVPLAALLPNWVSWENGLLEDSQVLVLLFGMLHCIFFSRHTTAYYRNMWLTGAGAFLLMAGRELSWGRVFFVRKVTENGPQLVPMKDMPYHLGLEILIGVYVLLLVIALIKVVPWKKLLQVPLPILDIFLAIIAIALAYIGDRPWFTDFFVCSETMEEIAELMLYILLCKITDYYYSEL